MLLARAGYRVLVVDRAAFPSDTISTHLVHPPGVTALRRWGLLERVTATGCPPIHTYSFDFGPFTISGTPGTDEAPLAYGPRRTVLDELLVTAASEAGAAQREARFVGTAVPNFFRKPFGLGWALIGDAGYTRDFITAQGITDAFRDAELCASALDETFSGLRSFEVAMARYQSTRDRHVLPIYEFTTQLATLEPPPPELAQLLGAVHGNTAAMDAFARVNGGVMSPAEFFSDENVKHIFATAAQRQAAC